MSSSPVKTSINELNLLKSLILVSEKAANIARICRSNENLLALLIQEKTGAEANSRFEHDFKTLADVLIQETIKHDIGALFSEMSHAINGEESPSFTNANGETVTITVGETAAKTAACLATALHGNVEAAEVLAAEVHREVSDAELGKLGEIPAMPVDLDYSNLGMWIDPIDATAEYISGDSIFTNFPGITSTGLDCVTVLIGVYDRTTGEPTIGVVSQPFHKKISENVYTSLVFWGVSMANLQANNICCQLESGDNSNRAKPKQLGIFSSSEDSDILKKFLELGYEMAFSAGAGHKSLKVITREADVYLLSKSSTFKWDTCAPHAILRSLGGNIYDYNESVKEHTPIPLNYLEMSEEDTGNWRCNKGGLIAARDTTLVVELLDILCEK